MAINPMLLVAAPMLQDYLVDNATGLPLANGKISLYQDNSRTTFKNWYYLSGSPGSYTYITLPNPMTLSAVGTITDGNGNDVIPYYYPFSETDNQTPQPYYIVVINSNGQQQFTRQNFPNNPEAATNVANATLRNYIVNNVFWRNIGSANVSNVTSLVLAPSQHDGFSMPDIQFVKNVTGATDAIAFTKFIAGDAAGQVLVNDITPEYYINFDCSASTTGETLKCVQIPISLHVKTLESVEASVVLHAQNVGGNVNNTLTLAIYQFLGTGVTSGNPIILQTLTLNPNWTKYVIPFVFPSASGLTLGNGGDDALYLQIGLPLNATCNINFTKPQIYLSTQVPDNDFDTYDDIDSIINSPRTGDVRTSVNSFYPFGWVPMNNGTIGNPTSNASNRANVDTWSLFNLLWNLAKPYDTGSNFNAICQMLNSSASLINFGSSAIADFNANNALVLTDMFGQVVMGSIPISAAINNSSVQPITASNSGGFILITIGNGVYLFQGQPIVFKTTGSLPGNLVTNAVYYVTNISGNTFNVATTYANALAGTPVVAYSSAGANSSVYLQPTGSTTGQYAHVQLTSELAAHTHPPAASTGGMFICTGSGGAVVIGNGGSTVSTNDPNATGTTGNSTAFNVVQQSTVYNIFMKL